MVRDVVSHDGGRERAESKRNSSRRTFLKAAGATGAAGLTGLAGCVTDVGGGGGDGIGTVRYGVVSPMSGAYGGLAVGQRQGAQLAVKQVNESDEFDFEIEAFYEDTQADPQTGQQVSQKLVDQDDIGFLAGTISSSVCLALNDFAQRESVLFNACSAAVPITGENCNEYVFRFETNAGQIAEATSQWTVENLGENVWFHIADYAYGQSVRQEMGSRMEEAGATIVDTSRSQLGASNYGTYISQISNSDADVAVIGATGGDLINFVKQAASQGLTDEMNIMAPTMNFQVVRGALGSDALGTYGGVRYLPKLETGDNQDFVSAYQEEYDGPPDNFARVGYESVRSTARAISEAGSSDPDEVKDTLAGMEFDSIFGPNNYRTCDHQATNPVWVGENVEGDGDVTEVELLQEVAGEDAIPPCSDVNCDLS